ncbi:MAG: phosphatase PAP2 family protein [Acidobacteria bacterium]|nr:phosphatase PAP2 family protein [Acidobacteriota bacterium]
MMKRNTVTHAYRMGYVFAILSLSLLLLQAGSIRAQSDASVAQESAVQSAAAVDRPCRFPNNCAPALPQIEPEAGAWKPWLLESGRELRELIPAPPATGQTEIGELIQFAQQRDASALDLIRYWDAGSPSYRWNEIALNQIARANLNTPRGARVLALINVAIYDAMIAAWDLKYLHRRVRPSELNPSLGTVLPNPQSPSYPSEHAVAAGAASGVLAYLFPNDAAVFADQAEAAGRSRLLAGVQYPSDVSAGFILGRAVAELVIDRARTDGSNAGFTGPIPTGSCFWRGANPVEPLVGTWRTWVLSSGSELRPGPPPACDSVQMATELAEVKNHPRPIPTTGPTFNNTRAAFFWQGPFVKIWHDILNQKLSEHHLDANPPRAARAYALFNVASYDATVAGWDAKYTYWSVRPTMLDPGIALLFPNPNHPSYPSAHAFVDAPYAAVLAYLFPRDKSLFDAQLNEAGFSRLWAGIHFRSDIEVGFALGRAVAEKAIERVRSDDSR